MDLFWHRIIPHLTKHQQNHVIATPHIPAFQEKKKDIPTPAAHGKLGCHPLSWLLYPRECTEGSQDVSWINRSIGPFFDPNYSRLNMHRCAMGGSIISMSLANLDLLFGFIWRLKFLILNPSWLTRHYRLLPNKLAHLVGFVLRYNCHGLSWTHAKYRPQKPSPPTWVNLVLVFLSSRVPNCT